MAVEASQARQVDWSGAEDLPEQGGWNAREVAAVHGQNLPGREKWQKHGAVGVNGKKGEREGPCYVVLQWGLEDTASTGGDTCCDLHRVEEAYLHTAVGQLHTVVGAQVRSVAAEGTDLEGMLLVVVLQAGPKQAEDAGEGRQGGARRGAVRHNAYSRGSARTAERKATELVGPRGAVRKPAGQLYLPQVLGVGQHGQAW